MTQHANGRRTTVAAAIGPLPGTAISAPAYSESSMHVIKVHLKETSKLTGLPGVGKFSEEKLFTGRPNADAENMKSGQNRRLTVAATPTAVAATPAVATAVPTATAAARICMGCDKKARTD